MRTSLFLVVISIFAAAATAMGARFDTSFRFMTVETPHFAIHYHQGLEEAARKTARYAEEAYDLTTARFGWRPAGKTQIVLIDDADFANGYATPLPYDRLYIQVVPPAIGSTLGEYDDWLKEIIFHEYTHIVTSDPARGYSKVTRAIFGKPVPAGDPLSLALFLATAPPNVFLPHWWHEGMATWSETEFTRAGRGRSTIYDMILRSAVAEKNLPTIDTINGDVPYWPDGSLPYIYGLRLVKFIADKYGADTPGRLAIAHAGRFPYAIGTPPEELCNGKDYRAIYHDMLDDLRREEDARIALLEKLPFTPLRLLDRRGENATGPRFSPSGALLAYTVDDPNGHRRTVITSRDGTEVRASFRRLPSDPALSWSPDGKRLYFAQAEIYRGFDVYQDLFEYDLVRDRTKRLTTGRRISEPEISPDGKSFAVVVSHRGSQNLALLDAREVLEGNNPPPRPITSFSLYRVASPRWSPDGKVIAYTVTVNAGKTSIRLHTVLSGDDRPLITASHTIAYPVWSPDGAILYYISDETGVFDLFAYRFADGRSSQVTHLLGGAMEPDVSPDGTTAAVASYTSRGFIIGELPLDPGLWLAGRSPAITPYWPKEEPPATGSAIPPAGKNAPSPLPAAPYTPWRTLLPRFWLPRVGSDDTGSTTGGIYTAGQDVLGYHTYILSLDYGARHHNVYYDATYQNDSLYPSFLLRAYAAPLLYADLLRRGDYYELNRGIVAEASIPLNFLESSYRLFFGYQILDQQAISSLANGDFNGLPVFQGRRDNIFAGVLFSDSLKYPYSISHEEGRDVSFTYRNFSRERGSDLDGEEFVASYREFLRLPGRLLRHHVAVLSLNGGVALGDRTVQQAFQIGGVPGDFNQFPLRGYPSRFETGMYAATGSIEYRAPLWYLLRGFGTKPFFLDRLHAALFTDAGEVWDDSASFRMNRMKVGAGLELRLDMTLGYWLRLTPAVGYAHGFTTGGEDQVYFTIYANL